MKKKRKLIKGKDWHGWAMKFGDNGELSFFAADRRPIRYTNMPPEDKWVKVKFVEVPGVTRDKRKR